MIYLSYRELYLQVVFSPAVIVTLRANESRVVKMIITRSINLISDILYRRKKYRVHNVISGNFPSNEQDTSNFYFSKKIMRRGGSSHGAITIFLIQTIFEFVYSLEYLCC